MPWKKFRAIIIVDFKEIDESDIAVNESVEEYVLSMMKDGTANWTVAVVGPADPNVRVMNLDGKE
jgi:hypothetical protein